MFKSTSNNHSGFSLLEMSVVMGISGVIAGGALVIGDAKHEQSKMEVTQKRLDKIENALELHVKTAGYLPCPAELDATIASAGFGVVTDCSVAASGSIIVTGSTNEEVRIGAVPIRALNLPDSYAYDAWNNRISYAVVTELAKDSATYDAYTTVVTDNVIQVVDKNANQIPDASKDVVVGFVIFSHGKDGKGSHNKVGSSAVACDAVQVDGENCDGDAIFVDMRIANSKIATKYYDDFMRWRVVYTLNNTIVKMVE